MGRQSLTAGYLPVSGNGSKGNLTVKFLNLDIEIRFQLLVNVQLNAIKSIYVQFTHLSQEECGLDDFGA